MGTHRETVGAPATWWFAAAAFAATWAWVVFVLAGPVVALVAGLLVAAGGFTALGRWAPRLEVDASGLRAGRAHLDAANVGRARSLDDAGMRAMLGAGADARAWLLTRPYVRTGVVVEVDDPRDPTPYWLLSSRRPDALVRALGSDPAPTPEGDHDRGEA